MRDDGDSLARSVHHAKANGTGKVRHATAEGAADARDACPRRAEVAHLALGGQIPHGPGHVLDRHGGVDPVLVEQVDKVCAQALERCLGYGADALGPATGAGRGRAVLEAELDGPARGGGSPILSLANSMDGLGLRRFETISPMTTDVYYVVTRQG
ncbi:hypothetical protein SR39_13140 [Methylobacterium radiotolerans]|nr:hypothetical protein SR39_13140 [Methylobacterium radiotolerans]